MYNWSIDEKEFKKEEEIIEFLKNQVEIEEIEKSNKKDRNGNLVIKVKISPTTHSVKRFCIAKYIEERVGNLKVSVVEK